MKMKITYNEKIQDLLVLGFGFGVWGFGFGVLGFGFWVTISDF